MVSVFAFVAVVVFPCFAQGAVMLLHVVCLVQCCVRHLVRADLFAYHFIMLNQLHATGMIMMLAIGAHLCMCFCVCHGIGSLDII